MERAREASSLEAAHIVALVDLAWSSADGKTISRTISSLARAARLAERPAPILADLAAAHLVRAERMQSPRDLLEAMETASHALEVDSLSLAARWNLALALDLDGLDAQAADAWQAYLRLDGGSAWAAEARARIRALAARPAPPPPASAADSAGVARFADQAPQEALMLGWDHVLGEWGEAVMRGDSIRAAERLRYARIMGGALVRRGRDATLADQARLISAAGGSGQALRRLAWAHGEHARARANLVASRRDSARAGFVRVLRDAAPASPLHRWATVFHGISQVYVETPSAGEPILRRAVAEADTLRHPALAGRARWLLGTSLLRQGRHRDASEAYREGARLLTRAGEHGHAGAALGYSASAEHHRGNAAGAYASLHAALMSLRSQRRSTWLHSALWTQADAAVADGYLRAAAHILAEDIAVTDAAGNSINRVEARTKRARVLLAGGSTGQPLEEMRADMSRLMERVEEANARQWLRAELWDVEVALSRAAAPAAAASLLDSAVAFWEAQGHVLRLVPRLVARADVRLQLGRADEARTDLRRAVTLLGTRRDSLAMTPERTSLLDAARSVAGRLALRGISTEGPGPALLELERSRAALLPTGAASLRRGPSVLRAPAGSTGLVHTLVGDTLLVWTVRGTSVHVERRTVDRASLLRSAEQAREGSAPAALRHLYDELVAPAAVRLGPMETTVLLVPDPMLEAVPYAALQDATGRYLVEDHPVRVAATLAQALAQAPPTRDDGRRRALLVDATAFDRRVHPGLSALPGAAAEVRSLVRGYPGARVISGAHATPASLVEALPHAGMVHFAGHALFDDEHPGRSRLVLSAGERGGASELTASQIEGLRLARGSLVVLSACGTVRAPSGRSGGFAGLAGAFIAAGARGVVGSLWEVDDAATHPLMVAFHQAYRRTRDPAAALRAAQLRMLGSPDPRLRSPAVWGAFRYSGS